MSDEPANKRLYSQELEKPVSQVYDLIDRRNQERQERGEGPDIPAPIEPLVVRALTNGHNPGEIVDELTEEIQDPKTRGLLLKCCP